ncbi:MAG: nucleoside 2-deoxyribosyltransferase [Nitrospirae bacterium]|nr:nucleoside 2-deoxyribosyltransferase [Nitrospirota bacterium]
MERKPIDIATAKEELVKINGVLSKPHLLIGGLAVNQYYLLRSSQDIDLVCEFGEAKEIMQKLYQNTRDWEIIDLKEDEYRPSYNIKHKVHEISIYFGPKIIEREAYENIQWDMLMKDSRPFKYKNEELKNILVPSPAGLAFTKILSFIGRKIEMSDKLEADLQDFVDLSNQKEFSIVNFDSIIRKSKAEDKIFSDFRSRNLSLNYVNIIEKSSIYAVSNLLGLNTRYQKTETNDNSNIISTCKQIFIKSYAPSKSVTVYLSAPHKNVKKNNYLATEMRNKGIKVYLPKEEEREHNKGSEEKLTPSQIRDICISAILKSTVVVVDLDTYGMDSAWEIGFAEAKRIPVIGYNSIPDLIEDPRLVNRRLYKDNFMHGWDNLEVKDEVEDVLNECSGKKIYIAGSFANEEALQYVRNSKLKEHAKTLLFPKDLITGKDSKYPQSYPYSARYQANISLEDSDIIIVLLPRYGMDVSWQIGYATGLGKKMTGLKVINDNNDNNDFVEKSFWDHWMHGWKQKIIVSNIHHLIALILGFNQEGIV